MLVIKIKESQNTVIIINMLLNFLITTIKYLAIIIWFIIKDFLSDELLVKMCQ